MKLQLERLSSLIQFVQESAGLKISPRYDVGGHLFCEYEHNIRGLPGVHFNNGCDDEEIWLTIERLSQTASPEPKNPLVALWIEHSTTPSKEPSLKRTIERTKMSKTEQTDKDIFGFSEKEEEYSETIFLESEKKTEIESSFKAYLNTEWIPWATEEKKRRQSIQLYNKLFRLKQQLEGCIVDSQIEFVWGVGVAVWHMNGIKVSHPLITVHADICVNTSTMAIEIRPREVSEQLELDIFNAVNNQGTARLEKEYKTYIDAKTQDTSPFDRSTFESTLRTAAATLDSNGIYWPEHTTADDRNLPVASDSLKVTDTWVLIGRPRSKSLLVHDLDRFKTALENDTPPRLTGAITAILTEPSKFREEISLSSYRGMSMVNGSADAEDGAKEVKELFFPKPFNNEQAQIVQLLEFYDGVVVQGPPGTGKTHTIANIISHYLAQGKRVLVTSMKEPALEVLREKLPEEIRPLAIALLTNNQQGMKQFEHSIEKIASEIKKINRSEYKKEIIQLDGKIHTLHGTLAQIDREIFDWAKKNLGHIYIDQEQLAPVDAAKEILEGAGQYEWLDDKLTLDNKALFYHADIARLREVRKAVGPDIVYLKIILPEITSLPTTQELIKNHKELSIYKELEQSINSGKLPALADASEKNIEEIYSLLEALDEVYSIRKEADNVENDPIIDAEKKLKDRLTDLSSIIEMFDAVGEELIEALKQSEIFLAKPVSTPPDIELDAEALHAIQNKAQGRLPFGIIRWIGKHEITKKLSEVQVLTSLPQSNEDWQHVHAYLNFRLRSRQLITRWNSIAPKLGILSFINNHPHLVEKAARYFSLHKALRRKIKLEKEIRDRSLQIIPDWEKLSKSDENEDILPELKELFTHHIRRHQLINIPLRKEKLRSTLASFTGKVVDELRTFTEFTLGNPDISVEEMQTLWSSLTDELSRLNRMQNAFAEIQEICHRIAESGAKIWASNLETIPVIGTTDRLLPDNWKTAWRLKQLATHLEQADPKDHLKKLGRQRKEVETTLAKTYEDIVAKRTWLKLAENATPDVRSALEAFRTAISKIGKGTGKRSFKYRREVRKSAVIANNAIPCWIMPHWRISESLPAQFGCFDLVIIDEASQSDLSALPALLRAQKILIVGDDKQVSPEGIGFEEQKIQTLMKRRLENQVDIFRSQMSPERSMYDLFKIAFAESSIMLKEHFRCVGPIIEYSKREVYNHELIPLRLPKTSERLDPPLIDVLVENGFRKEDTKLNCGEARFIVDEIKKICADPLMRHRTIGVVSLLGAEQALSVWEMIEKELGPEEIHRHHIACGDARTFQGKERDIIFLSMVVSPHKAHAQTRDTVAQRFNVAASRARDRMYLVRSIETEELSPQDTLRRQLISHFSQPYPQDEQHVEDLRMLCESDFEREVYDILTAKGYRVTPQVKIGIYRIDMVVEGENDNSLAIECDGDQYHGIDRWEEDMNRQRILERVGWRFWRCFASTFIRNRLETIEDLERTLSAIEIIPATECVSRQKSTHTEQRRVCISSLTHELPLTKIQ